MAPRNEALAGGREVEQTLRLARDEIERDISRYRIGLFGMVVLVTLSVRGLNPHPSWAPSIFFGVALALAVVAQRVVARVGARPAIVFALLAADLLVTPLSFLIMTRIDGSARGLEFAAFIAGPGVLITILINSLRVSRAASVVAAIVGPLAYVATIVSVYGFHPAEIPVTAILAIGGGVSFAAATRARQNLDRFARLQLLRRYLPPAAVERVLRDHPDAATAVGGKLLTVTLLSTDLRGFTALSEKLEPDQVLEQLNAYHAVMIEVIEQHGGAIDKFIGDGTLVVFGIEDPPEKAARDAIDCARSMLVALAEHNVARKRIGLVPLRMGIGVHTGSVIAGNIGVPGRRLEFTVIGDAVNTAARLEGQTKLAGEPVLVSGDTVELLGADPGLRELAPVSIRGKERVLRVFTLEA